MTTDITELAQSLKAAAEKATPGEWEVQLGDEVYATNDGVDFEQVAIATLDARDADFIALANPANILALVEALEKAQAKNALVAGGIEASTKLHERIAELDAELEREREKSRRVMSRIAELESRTVTVKLPPRIDTSNVPFAGSAWNYCIDEVEKRLTAAGIKLEAE
ncbi:ead/Ea22-like family protein [Raoultella terrigena]